MPAILRQPMLHTVYTTLTYAAVPLLPLRLWWRGRKEPGYRTHVAERFGRYRSELRSPVIWVHAVSLGETRAAAPLIERIRRTYPTASLLLTHMTATGRTAGQALFGGDVAQAWLSYDVPFAVRGFLEHFSPRVGLILETELWPNLLRSAAAARIPVYLVNARLSPRSLRGYSRVRSLVQPLLASLAGVAAQGAADAARLQALGAPAAWVTGNIKFDITPTPDALALGRALRTSFGAQRPVWVAGSTRDGEEALIIDALGRGTLPLRTLTVIVPRHPQRFAAVAELLRARGIAFRRRSDHQPVPADVAVVLGDTMGEMFAYYAAADVAFVGGSLLPLGGQNLIEPIAAGVPTLIGPSMFNFSEAAARATEAGAAREVSDPAALIDEVGALLRDERARAAMREAALAFHATHRGAMDRLWTWLGPRIDAALEVNPAAGG
jgi:3-deoxy-D-manno-octulosonic-acid transferase